MHHANPPFASHSINPSYVLQQKRHPHQIQVVRRSCTPPTMLETNLGAKVGSRCGSKMTEPFHAAKIMPHQNASNLSPKDVGAVLEAAVKALKGDQKPFP